MNLAHWIERHAAFSPDRPAIRYAGNVLTYAAFARCIRQAAARLASCGIADGDIVAFLGYNNPDMLVTLFACARLGAVLMPLNWRLAPPELTRALAHCQPRMVLVEEPFLASAQELRDAHPAATWIAVGEFLSADRAWESFENKSACNRTQPSIDGGNLPVLLCHTSGSTGDPKGVVLTQSALFWNSVNSAHMHDLTGADRVLTTLHMFHVGGLNIQTVPALHAGACVTLHARFDPRLTIETVERERITLAVLVPAQLVAMMEHPRWADADLSSLRSITTGSTIVPESFVRRVNARGLRLIQVYGSTETCPIAAYLRAEESDRKAGAAGLPALHCEVRVVDDDGEELTPGSDGEIVVRGPNVMRSYWNAPQATAAALRDGWYHSGDIGHFDDEGYLHVVSRKSDMIISGGENIYPAEIEIILAECPSIREVCVVGLHDEHWGEIVVAFVALQPSARMSEADVLALLTNRIARYKHPRAVRFVDALPRTELGKIKRSALQAAEPAMA
jgi:fatty-acyl-CoA synthase